MSTAIPQDAIFCSFTNGYGIGHRDPEAQMRCAVAAIEDNPENEPSPSLRSLTEDFLATHTRLKDHEIQRAGLILNVSRRWKNGRTIKVGFLNGTEERQQSVLEIARRWTKYAYLELAHETNLSAAEIRIDLSPGGSWSMLGNGALGISRGPTMQLGWVGEGVTLHEFGHGAIAAPHEQFHPERHCTYNQQAVIADLSGPPNNWSLAQIRANVLRPPWQGSTYTPYDSKSIMHYAQPANWFTNPACAVAPNHTLSRLDKRGAATWYPKPGIDTAIDVTVQALGTLRGTSR